jgi:glycosyltransferase involved in cell wall biosynthesis
MKKRRFAVLSHTLPPSPSGQAVMLYRILSGIDPEEYYVISGEMYRRGSRTETFLPADYFSIRLPRWLRPLISIKLPSFIRDMLNMIVTIPWRIYKLVQIGRANPVHAIIACTGDIADIPAGFLSSKILRTNFYAYIFDDYVYQWTGLSRLLAKLTSPGIFKRSAGIIGPNEYICDEYTRRYDVPCTLVRNPCGIEELGSPTNDKWPNELNRIRIVYTGAIYHANFDCFRNLIQAVKSLPEYLLELHIFTAQTPEQLATHGLESKKLFLHSHVPYNTILNEQRNADILFLPLAFDSPIPEVIRTSAPGKLGEYLASGRPVLAHVPSDSFVAYYFKRYHCGFAVDQNDPQRLATEIKKLITDPASRGEITHNARMRAKLDFSPEVARHRLLGLLYPERMMETDHG